MGIVLKINGEEREVSAATVAELIRELKLGDRRVAVELNKNIVPRDRFEHQALAAGDALEVIHFVGGG
jgi:thiamine biosynthesis protein ThiS